MIRAFVCNNARGMAFIAGCAALAVIVWASLSPIDYRPNSGFSVNPERELAFAFTGLAFVLGRPGRPLVLLALLIIFAGGLELMQTLVPTRHGRMEDFLVKSMGVTAGVILGVIANALARKANARAKS